MTASGSGHRPAVGDEPELDFAVVGQDRHAHAEVAGLRHPEHQAVDLRAGHVKRLLRAGHVGHHRRRIAREHAEQHFLQHARRRAHRREQAHASIGW